MNLLSGAGTHFHPDTAAMVAARDAFLGTGHYDPLAAALAATVLDGLAPAGPDPLLVDAGTGTGHYLAAVHRGAAARGIGLHSVGLDISKFALRRAARANPETANLVWDLWRPLPLAARAADAIMVVFAPRNAAEFARVLRPGGSVVVVTPLPDHLAEVAAVTGMLGVQPDKEEALSTSLAGWFAAPATRTLRYTVDLQRSEVAAVAMMGPSGHHLDAAAINAQVAGLPETSAVTAAFRISEFRLLPQREWNPS